MEQVSLKKAYRTDDMVFMLMIGHRNPNNPNQIIWDDERRATVAEYIKYK